MCERPNHYVVKTMLTGTSIKLAALARDTAGLRPQTDFQLIEAIQRLEAELAAARAYVSRFRLY